MEKSGVNGIGPVIRHLSLTNVRCRYVHRFEGACGFLLYKYNFERKPQAAICMCFRVLSDSLIMLG